MIRILLAAALALLPAAPAAAQTASTDAEEVKATLVAMWDAINKNDMDRYATYIHPDFSSFGENDVYLSEGKEAEVAGYRDYLTRASNVQTRMHQPAVTVRGDTAWITYYWTESAIVNGQRSTSRGKSTRIFVKEGGRWLCIHGHYTAVP